VDEAASLPVLPMTTDIPEEVRRLVQGHLPTMDHLEILLYLVRKAPEGRTIPEIVEAVSTQAKTVADKLADLVESRLVVTEHGVYRYRDAPDDPTQGLTVQGLLYAYNTLPMALIRLVYERPTYAAHLFANAFRLRKPTE
jgi:hypothetical protein